jgi:hypothetical protein
MFGSISHSRFMCVCLVRFLATVQVTLLLFARLERSRTPTLDAWDFGLEPDSTLFIQARHFLERSDAFFLLPSIF